LSKRAEAPAGGERGVELWCVDLKAAAPALAEMERLTPRLASGERQEVASFADAEVAAERLAARIAVRLLLERIAGTRWRSQPLVRDKNGKPRLAGAPVVFSLSHVAGLALIGAAASGPIGVDLERARDVRVRAPRRARLEEAGAVLNAAQALPDGEDARFLQAWVRLEAFAKADGCGIGRLLTRLGIVGERELARAELLERIERARARVEGAVTRDLALGEGLFAAIACAPASTVPEIRWLPTSIDGLEKVLS